MQRVDRIQRKHQRSGDKIDDAHNRLNNRNESVNAGQLYVPECHRQHVYDRQDDDDAEGDPTLSHAYWHRGDNDWEIVFA
jgi:hypothetical protein